MSDLELVEFVVEPKHLTFKTQVNGDSLVMSGLVLSADQAASLAYMINNKRDLKVEIKTNL